MVERVGRKGMKAVRISIVTGWLSEGGGFASGRRLC